MGDLWLVLGICVVLVLGAAVPLIRDRSAAKEPPIQHKETLRDWRQEKSKE
jgi:hypothetical protein